MRVSIWRRALIVAIMAATLVLPWAPAAQAIGDTIGDTAESSTPSFDLWDWFLQLFGMGNATVSSASTESGGETTPEEPTPTPTGLSPVGLLDGEASTGDDEGDGGAGFDPEG